MGLDMWESQGGANQAEAALSPPNPWYPILPFDVTDHSVQPLDYYRLVHVGGGGGGRAAQSGMEAAWVLVNQVAKAMVADRLRTPLGGPAETLEALRKALLVGSLGLASCQTLASNPTP